MAGQQQQGYGMGAAGQQQHGQELATGLASFTPFAQPFHGHTSAPLTPATMPTRPSYGAAMPMANRMEPGLRPSLPQEPLMQTQPLLPYTPAMPGYGAAGTLMTPAASYVPLTPATMPTGPSYGAAMQGSFPSQEPPMQTEPLLPYRPDMPLQGRFYAAAASMAPAAAMQGSVPSLAVAYPRPPAFNPDFVSQAPAASATRPEAAAASMTPATAMPQGGMGMPAAMPGYGAAAASMAPATAFQQTQAAMQGSFPSLAVAYPHSPAFASQAPAASATRPAAAAAQSETLDLTHYGFTSFSKASPDQPQPITLYFAPKPGMYDERLRFTHVEFEKPADPSASALARAFSSNREKLTAAELQERARIGQDPPILRSQILRTLFKEDQSFFNFVLQLVSHNPPVHFVIEGHSWNIRTLLADPEYTRDPLFAMAYDVTRRYSTDTAAAERVMNEYYQEVYYVVGRPVTLPTRVFSKTIDREELTPVYWLQHGFMTAEPIMAFADYATARTKAIADSAADPEKRPTPLLQMRVRFNAQTQMSNLGKRRPNLLITCDQLADLRRIRPIEITFPGHSENEVLRTLSLKESPQAALIVVAERIAEQGPIAAAAATTRTPSTAAVSGTSRMPPAALAFATTAPHTSREGAAAAAPTPEGNTPLTDPKKDEGCAIM